MNEPQNYQFIYRPNGLLVDIFNEQHAVCNTRVKNTDDLLDNKYKNSSYFFWLWFSYCNTVDAENQNIRHILEICSVLGIFLLTNSSEGMQH
jgi:hypothetical protein